MEFFGYLLYSFILLKPMVIIVIIGFFMPFTDYLIAPLINLLNSLSNALSNIGSPLYLPQMGGIFTVLLIIGIITIFILSKKKRVMSLIGIMGILFICFLYHPLSNGIYFLDVGQGDSCVIIKDNHAMVIDAYNQTFNFLMSNNIRNIDYLILSHNDNDHIGDAPKIIKYLHPSQIVMARNLDYQLSGPSTNASDGDCFVFQEIEILIMSSLKNNKSPNNNSLCLKFNYLNYELLFVGDIESEVEIELVSRYAHSLDSDILKVAHHGSKTSSTQSFIQMVSPTYAIISLKKNNMYGFPHIETIKTLTSSRALIYTTSTSGTIAFLKNNKIITYPPKD
jgi:competence protein ComEC